jgi:uncharacterized protein YdeI (YjbR/CyaY-like superfamily)
MGSLDPRVDAYIAKAAPFARPILQYLRDTVHSAVPEVSETMKWSVPHFDYHGIFCSMAAFKAHCAFGFWKGALLFPDAPAEKAAAGHLGRIESLDDLPPKRELVALLKKAARLNAEGTKVERERKVKPDLETPADLHGALKRNKAARETFEKFSPSQRRDYVEWLIEAKSDATRQRRLEQAVEWIAEGKPRHWKYVK